MKHQKQLLTYHNESWKKLRIGTKDCPQKNLLKVGASPKTKTSVSTKQKKTLKYSNGNKLFKHLENN
jgi:hypothetical protein